MISRRASVNRRLFESLECVLRGGVERLTRRPRCRAAALANGSSVRHFSGWLYDFPNWHLTRLPRAGCRGTTPRIKGGTRGVANGNFVTICSHGATAEHGGKINVQSRTPPTPGRHPPLPHLWHFSACGICGI
jgi:hypothetical protein